MISLATFIELLQYLSIPVIAALIGWATNWLAIKMTFYPIEFFGWPPYLGWQGIIPSKARKMALISVDATIAKIGTVPQIFQQLDPNVLATQLIHTINPRLEGYVNELMMSESPALWQSLPGPAKWLVYERARKALPALVMQVMDDIAQNVEQLLDIKTMVINQLTADKTLLNRIFLTCGYREFHFIVKSGLYLGFGFGLLQMLLWYVVPVWWVLPLGGLMVGFATNWIALNVIFRPLYPVQIGRWRIQGLFLKRQPEVAESFCHIVAHDILTVGGIIDAILDGPRGEQALDIVKAHLRPLLNADAGVNQTLAHMALGPTAAVGLRNRLENKAVELSRSALSQPAFQKDRARAIESIMVERMRALSSSEFQDLLRPCFQEDEIKLILVGAALGMLAGIGQLVLVFGQALA